MPIQETKWIWFNGKLVEWKDAKIHVLTHCLHYGSGVFEGIRAYETVKGTAIFRLTDHLKRLYRSAKIYFMDIPFTLDELREACKAVVRENHLSSAYVRPIAFRGYGEMGLYPLNSPVDVAVAAWSWGTYLGDEGIRNGIRVKTSSFRRIDVNTIPAGVKATGQYINSVLAKVEAKMAGYDEAVMLDSRGMVSEGSGENIFMVRNSVVYTPSTSSGILEGITRDTVFHIVEDMGLKVVERDLTRVDFYYADEAFMSGTAAEVVPVVEMDNYKIGDGKPGPITRRIQDEFYRIVRGQSEKYSHWLEPV
ncbi:MAG: branched-chain amino acid transaminase [Candidatus Brockarchaeota archaeon]|nr:branched-chain amino acid transaminase [Candidatus Brockarchaeota archaeon]